MATINIGGRTVEVPDDLDPSKPPQQQPLRSAGGAPYAPNSAPPAQPGDLRAGATRPLPDADAATYNNSPEGRASQRQYHSARAQQAGVGAGYSGAPPVGNNATAGAAAEAEAAARYAQQTGRAAPGAVSAAPATPPVSTAAPKSDAPARSVLRRGADWAGRLGGAVGAAVGKASVLGGVGYGTYGAAKGLADGNYGDAALGAADAAASASLVTPAAPIGATWLGARAAHGILRSAVDSREAQDVIGGTINALGQKTGLWGVDDSAYLQQKAEQNLRNPAPTAAAQNPVTQPATPEPSSGAGLGGPPAPSSL